MPLMGSSSTKVGNAFSQINKFQCPLWAHLRCYMLAKLSDIRGYLAFQCPLWAHLRCYDARRQGAGGAIRVSMPTLGSSPLLFVTRVLQELFEIEFQCPLWAHLRCYGSTILSHPIAEYHAHCANPARIALMGVPIRSLNGRSIDLFRHPNRTARTSSSTTFMGGSRQHSPPCSRWSGPIEQAEQHTLRRRIGVVRDIGDPGFGGDLAQGRDDRLRVRLPLILQGFVPDPGKVVDR